MQATFFASAKALLAHGIHYDTRQRTHHRIARVLHGRPTPLAQSRTLKELVGDIAASGASKALISSETFVRCTAEEARDIVAYFRQHAKRVRVLLYVRHPVSYASSAAHQGVRVGRSLKAVIADPRIVDLTALVEVWREAAGADGLIVRPFARPLLTNGDIVDDVLDAIGVPEAAPAMTRVMVNEGLSVLGIHLIDAANRAAKEPPLPQRLIRIFEAVAGPRYVLPEHSLAMVAAMAEPHLAFLNREYGIVLPEPTDRPSPPVELSEAELASLAAVMMDASRHMDAWDRSPASRIVGLASPFAREVDRAPQPFAQTLGKLGLGALLKPRPARPERRAHELEERFQQRAHAAEVVRKRRRPGLA
ncbi:hypothetical protein [Acuticoccus kandeliae]|uniref:hypothetical protein n=1 Tax=Acuticoccus kandeliae TaxID=2073160 RepID=UPI0013001C92|nr:hypothetical protein [Acuticoccus kandeliae]